MKIKLWNPAVVVLAGLWGAPVFASGERAIDFKAHLQGWWGGGWNQTDDVGGTGVDFRQTGAWGWDFALSEGPGAVALVVGMIHQEGDESSGGVPFKLTQAGWLVGVRHNSLTPASNFYIGAGAAFLETELNLAGVRSKDDQVCFWAGCGYYLILGSGLTLGVDFKWLDADTQVGNTRVDLEGYTVGFSVGFMLD